MSEIESEDAAIERAWPAGLSPPEGLPRFPMKVLNAFTGARVELGAWFPVPEGTKFARVTRVWAPSKIEMPVYEYSSVAVYARPNGNIRESHRLSTRRTLVMPAMVEYMYEIPGELKMFILVSTAFFGLSKVGVIPS